MRTHHTHYTLPLFPVYSAAFVSDQKLVLGGGGGSSRSGVKNKLRLYHIPNDETLELLSELELEKDEDAPMSMAADTEDLRVICGINSATEELDKGINQNCRTFSTEKDKINLVDTASTLNVTRGNMEECQKVTVLSPGRTLVVAAGTRDLSVLSYPSLSLAAKPLRTENEIYDASFSPTSLIVATTKKLLIYALPAASAPAASPAGPKTRSKQKQKKRAKSASIDAEKELELLRSEPIEPPDLDGVATVFRAVRHHPSSSNVVYTVLNTASEPRTRGPKSKPKQGSVCRWNSDTWKVVKSRKVGERGITCFDVSPNGQYLAYGAADYSIGILDAITLAPLLSVLKAHDFPPTVLRFNPTSKLLVSGSADNSLRAVTVPEGLHGTTWTVPQVLFITLLILLLSILISYTITSGRLGF